VGEQARWVGVGGWERDWTGAGRDSATHHLEHNCVNHRYQVHQHMCMLRLRGSVHTCVDSMALHVHTEWVHYLPVLSSLSG
jgi:hypothetical protein